MIDCIEKGVTTRQLILVVALDEPTAAFGSDCGERDLQPLQFLCAKQNGHLHFASAVQLRLDTIAVFDHARLVESGTHTALLAADGQYAALWNAQAKYYV